MSINKSDADKLREKVKLAYTLADKYALWMLAYCVTRHKTDYDTPGNPWFKVRDGHQSNWEEIREWLELRGLIQYHPEDRSLIKQVRGAVSKTPGREV